MNRIKELMGIEYPIIQGGMAWVADHNIAAAVSNAGGLGIIGVGGADENWLRNEIREIRKKTDKPFGVNLMLMNPRAEKIAEVIRDEEVNVVTTGAGSPEKYIQMWKDKGIIVAPVIASVAYARRMESLGADAVIAEGTESGGHIGELTTMALVPQVRDAIKIPLVAAGGIADGRGMAAAFMLGAEAVQCGTIFCASNEVNIHDNYKLMIVNAKDISTKVTGRSTGHPVRQIKNQLTNTYISMEEKGATLEELEGLAVGSLRKAVVEGDTKEGTFMAGQIAGLIRSVRPVEEIIHQMMDEARQVIKGASGAI